MNPRDLRKTLRSARRTVPRNHAQLASAIITRHLTTQLLFLRAKRMAFYMPSDGELDPTLLMMTARLGGKHCYLPVMTDKMLSWQSSPLAFVDYDPLDEPLVVNRYGILEPAFSARRSIGLEMLDIVFMPLVGFDRRGNRLGMGKGFYDRAFANLNRHFRRPKLIGLAYQLQEVDELRAKPWDVRLDAVVTEAGFLTMPRTAD